MDNLTDLKVRHSDLVRQLKAVNKQADVLSFHATRIEAEIARIENQPPDGPPADNNTTE